MYKGVKDDLQSWFYIDKEALKDVKVLFAYYSYEDYSGDAFVVFKKDGKYYEVNGSHCSCYGLEGQWEPEETSKEELLHRYQQGYLKTYGEELLDVIKRMRYRKE